MSRSIMWLVAATVALTGGSAFAGWSLKGDTTLGFEAKGNIGMKISGVCKTVSAKDDGKTLTITAALKDCDTDIGLRNKHMLEDIKAEENPDVVLTVPLDALKPTPDDTKVDAKGTFTMHAKAVEQPFKYSAVCKDNLCTVNAEMEINLKNHDIKIRSYMGVTVKPEVKISVSMTVAK